MDAYKNNDTYYIFFTNKVDLKIQALAEKVGFIPASTVENITQVYAFRDLEKVKQVEAMGFTCDTTNDIFGYVDKYRIIWARKTLDRV